MNDGTPLWLRCDQCLQSWIGAELPCPLEDVAALLHGRGKCPICGGPAVVARQNAGRLLDAAIYVDKELRA